MSMCVCVHIQTFPMSCSVIYVAPFSPSRWLVCVRVLNSLDPILLDYYILCILIFDVILLFTHKLCSHCGRPADPCQADRPFAWPLCICPSPILSPTLTRSFLHLPIELIMQYVCASRRTITASLCSVANGYIWLR